MPHLIDLNIPSTIVGAAVGWGVTEGLKTLQRYRERKGALDGLWLQIIPAQHERAEQRDLVTVIHRGELIEGTVQGESPESRRTRRWKFTGTLRFGFIFGHFWSTNTTDTSFGTVYIRQTSNEATSLQGTYTRLHIDPEKRLCETATSAVEWRRIPKH
jgi:hypothetical protein